MKKVYFLLIGCLGLIQLSMAQAPTNLSLRVVSPAQICVSWTDNTTSELGFEVERSTDRLTYTKVADVAANTTEFCNINLSPSTLYYYRVRAKLTATTFSGYSNTDFATTQAAPDTPTGLAVSVLSTSSLRLQWGSNTFAYQYDIERRTGQTGAFAVIATVSFARLINRQYDNTGLNDGTEYCYRVRVRENDGTTSAYSAIACATTPLAPPTAPARLTATAVSATQINLSWADLSDNESGFEIERSTDTRNYTKIADVGANVTTYQNTGLNDNTQYCYRVRAKNTAGNSAYTDPACATTPLAPPTAPARLTATAVSATQINLSWADLSDNETGFEIERSTDTRNYTKIADVGANVTTYQNTGLNDNTQYCYRVRAKNTAGNSAYTDPACATTPLAPPAVPARLTATAVSATQINLSWADLSDNESGFQVERGSDGVNFTKIADVAANTTSYANTGLTANTRYYYRVRAVNTAGNSAYSNVADATTLDTPPLAPTRLTATAVSSSQINLSWVNNSTNETGIEVERSTDGTTFTNIATLRPGTTTYQSTGLTAATRYWYRVRAVNAAGNSAYSNVADATTLDTPPNAPARLTATAVSSSQIDLTWADLSNNETGFEIESSPDGTTFTKIADVAANVTTYQNTGLTASTRYWYRVRAKNSAGNSSYSNIADATTQAPPVTIPRPPSNLTATTVSSSQIDLAWTDNATDETGFEIERSPDGTTFTKIADVAANVTTYQNTGLTASTRYWYRVRAKNTAGNSAYSNIADATTQAPPVTIPRPPSALTATAISSSQIDLAWTDNATDETGFEIERSPDGTTFTKIADVAANATTYQSTGLNASTRYWYRVRAKNSAGNSSYSNIADATTQAPPVTIPRPPSNLVATAISSSQIDLAWTDNATDETGFEIERSPDGTTFTKIADVAANATTYQNTGLTASTRYWYRVRAKNSAGNSTYSNIADATTQAPPVTIPRPPSNLVATAVSSSQIDLAWTDNATDETGFEIERSPDGTTFTKIADVAANVTTYQNTGLTASTRYWYRVRAKNSAGNSAYSNIADATTQAPPVTIPRPPSALTATAVSSSQIDLAWTDNATDETGFEIERSPDGTTFTKIADVVANATTYQNTGLTASTRYWYRVRAKNSAGNSAYSNIADATTQAPPVTIPRPPSALTATVLSSSQIDLVWTDNATDEAGFEIERSTDGTNFTKIADVATNVTFYSNTGLSPSTRYWYRVRAKNTAGNSAYSNVADATTSAASTGGGTLAAPQNLRATPIDFDLVRLSWTPLPSNTPATSIIIERSTSPTAGFVQIGQVPADAIVFADKEILNVVNQYYRIKAVNATNSSPYSNVATVLANAIITAVPASVSPKITIAAASEKLLIRLEQANPSPAQVSVYSLAGMPVYQAVLPTDTSWQVDLHYQTGLFIVVVETNQAVATQKIILP
ncbi:MAG: fibronectin type III domain-containing protein [Spirosomataceae bacterium]